MTETTRGARDVFSVRRFFRPDSPEGVLGLVAGGIVLITPTLAYVFSQRSYTAGGRAGSQPVGRLAYGPLAA